MCGRFALIPNNNSLSQYYNLPIDLKVDPDYNVSPSQNVPVIIMKDKLDMEYMQWGFIPYWSKDEKFKIINARMEEIEEKAAFKANLITKRCIVPASGFYEWQRDGKHKKPYYFKLNDREVFSFAGLFSERKNSKGEISKTFTIITTKANSLVGHIHERMPVIISKEDEERWLDPSLTKIEEIKKLLKPYPASKMIAYKVTQDINYSNLNNEEFVQPLE